MENTKKNMSSNKKIDQDSSVNTTSLPKNLPAEFIPLYDWWQTNGNTLLTAVGVCAILFGGVYFFHSYRANRLTAANQAFLKARSLEDLESIAAQYGSTKPGNIARIQLAKNYYDAANYDAALRTYKEALKQGLPTAFRGIAELGCAHALEGLNQLPEALESFVEFATKNQDHFLYAQAVMGEARVMALMGRKDEARNRLEKLKAEKTGEIAVEMAVANLDNVIARYEPRSERSLFDMADATLIATNAPVAPKE